MSAPGRNADGTFARDDSTVKQILERHQQVLRMLVGHMCEPSMDGVTRQLWAELCGGYLDESETGIAALDTGRRPKKESNE